MNKDLVFDKNGLLTPYKAIETDLETLDKYFTTNETRKAIYQNYLDYLLDLKSEISPNFRQWINGSFVTLKEKPNDIDIVTFLDFQTCETLEKKLTNFKGLQLLKDKQIDAYFIKVYPKDHQFYAFTEGDILEWLNQFSYTRRNKQGRRLEKGFLEINF
jgi:hypothetical protein